MRRCIGSVSTWSAYRAFKAKNGSSNDPLDRFYEETVKALKLQSDDEAFEVELPIFGWLARYPQQITVTDTSRKDGTV